MGRADYHRRGDFNRICDVCGFKRKASDTIENWRGLLVCADTCFEHRHPQDFVRGQYDEQRVYKARPDSEPDYLEEDEITADDF